MAMLVCDSVTPSCVELFIYDLEPSEGASTFDGLIAMKNHVRGGRNPGGLSPFNPISAWELAATHIGLTCRQDKIETGTSIARMSAN